MEQTSGKVSGAWVFCRTRTPLFALYENLASGAIIKKFVEWFLDVDARQVHAVLKHEAETLKTALGGLPGDPLVLALRDRHGCLGSDPRRLDLANGGSG